MLKLWPWGQVLNHLGNWPLLGSLLRPCFDDEGNRAVIIPVQEAVHGAESAVLPFSLLTPLISMASERFILNRCLCRQGERCHSYPQELGCIFLGDGVAEIDPALGRRVDVKGALAHTQHAMVAGLMPTVVHSAFDAWLLDIPYRRALAVCFCCDCCCSVRQGLRSGPAAFWDTVVRLPGLSFHVGLQCTGCSVCLDLCPVSAISLDNGRAITGEGCKGCGRCAAACPAETIELHLVEGADAGRRLAEQFARRTEIKPRAPATEWP